ncbi:hypothetical protein [Pollutibacter soli]|uniref:hypothetical protein n=1 Tax=Pollutibacter soli TaxID=3034157 RepID=UPI00301408D2
MKKILMLGSIAIMALSACGTGGDKSFDNSDSATIGPASPDTSSMQTLPQDSMPQDSVSTTGRSGNR